MSRMECVACGLAPCDLPDGVDPELVFERVNGQWLCQGDAGVQPKRRTEQGGGIPNDALTPDDPIQRGI